MTVPQVLKNVPPLQVLEQAISIRTLQLALLQQQYAPNDPLLVKTYSSPTETTTQPSGNRDFDSDKVTVGDATSFREGFISVPPSPRPMSRDNSHMSRENLLIGGKERSLLSNGLEQASCSELSSDEMHMLTDLIKKFPSLVLEMFEPTVQMCGGTIRHNPKLFREWLLPLLVADESPFREEYYCPATNLIVQANCRTYSTLTFLPVSLPVLETIYLIIDSNPFILHNYDSQSSRLVHDFLAHAERQLETLSADSHVNPHSMDECDRLVRMMCLFFESLLREGKIELEEYRLEIREFCLKFVWNVDAATVFTFLSSF